MFVLELTYTAPADEVDALREAHMEWVDEQFEAGVFIASGRKKPLDGGVILAVGDDRDRIEAVVASDPFVQEEVCGYRVTQFTMTRTAPGLEEFRQQPVG
ncbi:YciI family protein [Streptomyces pathocidini]|uniref:YciI family protein n=1 Tax=Streptomyces pathocidini TaxID=1650571 RepID=A0ABW7UMF1_9ACTN|nr:YciI family protein [Streptomyces pathocidini]